MKKELIISLCIAASSCFGQLVSFNPISADSDVVAADMNASTTGEVGGTWTLNGAPSAGDGSIYKAYSDSTSDFAMLWDYITDNGSSLDLSLSSAQNFADSTLYISWDLARTRAAVRGKVFLIVGYGADGSTEAFRFEWKQEDKKLYASGAGGAQEMGAFDPYSGGATALTTANMATMGVTLDGTNITYSAVGLSAVTLEVQNDQTAISKISFEVDVAANGVGVALDNVNIATEQPAQIVAFTATPEIFEVDETVTLSWEVSNADSVSIDNGIGSVAATGSLILTPTESTSWTLTAVHGEQTTSATVSVQTAEDELYEGPEYEDAYSNPDDNPALPNVLLIGDSISIGYTVQVRMSLAGKADVYRIPSNGKYSAFGLTNIDSWIGTREWDVIHFNWGLWDLCYRNSESNNQGGRDKVDGTLTATPEEYKDNMEQIVARLKETDASLIWCATTPVPEGELGRVEGDDIIYNDVATAIMATNSIPTDDLHSYALLALPEIQKSYGDVHFSDAGYVYLGEEVARVIEVAIADRFIGDLAVGSSPNGPGTALTWQARSGVSYGVMATTNLVDGAWGVLTNGIVGDDRELVVTNNITGGQMFFQVFLED